MARLGRATVGAMVLMASFGSTALADPLPAPNIPSGSHEDVESPAIGEDLPPPLPRPYDAWRGVGYRPAPPVSAPEAPLPLPRPPELGRRPFEMSASAAAFLPSCAAGSIDDRGCSTVGPGAGLDVALLYRVGPFFAAGIDGAFSGFGGRGQAALAGAGGSARFVGVVGRVYFADSGSWDPYVSLTLGYGALTLARMTGERRRDVAGGFGARVGGGVDFLPSSRLRLGPTLGFTHFVVWREQGCAADICSDQPLAYGRLLGFATLGLRLTASFGEAL